MFSRSTPGKGTVAKASVLGEAEEKILEEKDVTVFRQSLAAFDAAAAADDDKPRKPPKRARVTTPLQVIEEFTKLFCTYFAGFLSGMTIEIPKFKKGANDQQPKT